MTKKNQNGTLPAPKRGATAAYKQHWKKFGAILFEKSRLDSTTLEGLDLLCRLYSDLADMDASIAENGLMVTNSQGLSANPIIQHRGRCYSQILQCLKALGLEGKEVKPGRSKSQPQKPSHLR